MTTLALGEEIGRFLTQHADKVSSEQTHDKVVHHVMIGKQVFVVTCIESTPDSVQPAV